MSLTEWLNQGYLTEHKTSRREINDFLRIVDRDLADCQTKEISPDWQLAIAYNAALQAATAALAATGYRSKGEGAHYRVIQSLKYTIGATSEVIIQFDGFRKKRNISDYDRAGSISEKEVEEMYSLALTIHEMVLTWLKTNHPDIIGE